MYHFVKQDYGLMCLHYMNGKPSSFDFSLDKSAIWVGAAVPVLIIHSYPGDEFNWFGAGEKYLFHLTDWAVSLLWIFYVSFAVFYAARQVFLSLSGVSCNVGKLYIVAATWGTWLTILSDNWVITLAFLNLFHGIPFFFMVFMVCYRKWKHKDPKFCGDRFIRFCIDHPWAFFLFLFFVALLEEILWDAFINQEYLPGFLGLNETRDDKQIKHVFVDWILPESLSPFAQSFAHACLSLPQIVHYYLDSQIWKMDPQTNPGLREYLFPKKIQDAGKAENTGNVSLRDLDGISFHSEIATSRVPDNSISPYSGVELAERHKYGKQ